MYYSAEADVEGKVPGCTDVFAVQISGSHFRGLNEYALAVRGYSLLNQVVFLQLLTVCAHKLPSKTSMMQGYVQHFGMLNETQMAMFDNQFFNMSAEEAAWQSCQKSVNASDWDKPRRIQLP